MADSKFIMPGGTRLPDISGWLSSTLANNAFQNPTTNYGRNVTIPPGSQNIPVSNPIPLQNNAQNRVAPVVSQQNNSKRLEDMTVAEATAAGRIKEYNALWQGTGSTSNNNQTTSTIQPPVFQPGSQPQTGQGADWDTFNNDLLGLLNQSKGFSSAELQAKKRNLELETYKRLSALTPENLRTMSPEQQRSYRVSGVDALSEEKAANAYDLQRQQDAVVNFFNIYDRASKISQDFADKMSPPKETIDNMVAWTKSNPEVFDNLFSSLNKNGQKDYVNGLNAAGVSLSKPTTGTDRKTSWQGGKLYDDTTGELIKDPNASGMGSVDANTKFTQERGADKIKQIESLAGNSVGLSASAGFKNVSINPFNTNTVNDWRAEAVNVVSRLTVDELGRVKADGVTFGALSDSERKAVGDAASVLSAGMIMEKNKDTGLIEPTGRFKLSESKVKEAFALIQKYAEIDFERRTGQAYSEYKNQSLLQPDDLQEINGAYGVGSTTSSFNPANYY